MMKIFRKSKAFTLIELLAVITIIGIFLLVTFPLVTNAIITSQLKYYVSQENTILISGRNYFTIDRSRLPKNMGEEKMVTLATLLDEGYLKPVLDIKNNNCHYDESYVAAKNISKGEYQYSVRLVCDEYDTLAVLGEWSDWSTEEPTGDNIDVQSAVFYNYQTPTTYYSEWTNWIDVAVYRDDQLRPVSEIVGSETENRTVYRYKDQQWKWYKVDTEYSSCVTSSPGAGWVFYQTGSCQPTQQSTGSCMASAPDGTYSVDYQCANPSPPGNNGVCAWSTPGTVAGGTWSRGSSCDHDHWYSCPGGYTLNSTTCSRYDSYGISSVIDISCTCSGGTWGCIGVCRPGGNCNAPCANGYSKSTWLTGEYDPAGGSCSPNGSTTTGYSNWSGICEGTLTTSATQYTDYAYTYTWTATNTYVWKHSVATGTYSKTGNIYDPNFSSTSPTGYPNKDVAQTQYTSWTSWDINIPTTYTYRTIENKGQVRTRNIIRDWSGNVLPKYLLETDLITTLGKSLSELSADPNIKLVTQTMYRYRIRRS